MYVLCVAMVTAILLQSTLVVGSGSCHVSGRDEVGIHWSGLSDTGSSHHAAQHVRHGQTECGELARLTVSLHSVTHSCTK
jgi:hypothetical protein